MTRITIFVLAIFSLLPSIATAADDVEKVALRAADGRFLSVTADGTVRADAHLPGPSEQFELVPIAADRIALKAATGRLLVAAGPDRATLAAVGGNGKPRAPEIFTVVPAKGNVLALRSYAGGWAHPSIDKPPKQARLEIYRISEIPALLQASLAAAAEGLVKKELDGKEYDKTRSELKVRSMDVPAPTLRNPFRMKRQKLWATRHEYRIQAHLDGQAQIRVTAMPYLKTYRGPEARLMMFAAEAELPVRGRVGYRIPERVSASTGFYTTVSIRLVGQVRVEKKEDRLVLAPPEVVQLDVALKNLDISNDLVNIAADPIEDIINAEVRDQRARILEQANKAASKGFDGGEFRNPLLRYLNLP